ncbi:unnamed protein product [Nyctereutes procyonoides]|uniref:(raccoon dog) hypothetical protein n=1 Tax=Nyctereutes procyonoides TaxID=34880 RepID=A0A811ZJR8_NYCPR|nr:unnamed protein product [Nyctereutes procyonoides]
MATTQTQVAQQFSAIFGPGHYLGDPGSSPASGSLRGACFSICLVSVSWKFIVRMRNYSNSFSLNKDTRTCPFLRKQMNTNPSCGPYHSQAPSCIFWGTVRGVLPHKTKRGLAALDCLKVFGGIPPPYDKKKWTMVPAAPKVYQAVTATLEKKRTEKFMRLQKWVKKKVEKKINKYMEVLKTHGLLKKKKKKDPQIPDLRPIKLFIPHAWPGLPFLHRRLGYGGLPGTAVPMPQAAWGL